MTRLPADARLVIIADTGFAGPNRVVELIRAALPEKGGSRIIVVERDKRPASEQNDQERLERLKALRQLTRERGVALVVNQRLDLAIASDADGIHLPERGLPLDVVQAIAPHLWLGRSCHDAEGLKRAEEAGADWAFLSPIAPPFSKTTSLPPIGVDAFGLLVSQLSGGPVQQLEVRLLRQRNPFLVPHRQRPVTRLHQFLPTGLIHL
mgnify:CR=1 FL=1